MPGWGRCLRSGPSNAAAATPESRGPLADRAWIGWTGGGLGQVCAIRTLLGYSGYTRVPEFATGCAGLGVPAGKMEKLCLV